MPSITETCFPLYAPALAARGTTGEPYAKPLCVILGTGIGQGYRIAYGASLLEARVKTPDKKERRLTTHPRARIAVSQPPREPTNTGPTLANTARLKRYRLLDVYQGERRRANDAG